MIGHRKEEIKVLSWDAVKQTAGLIVEIQLEFDHKLG